MNRRLGSLVLLCATLGITCHPKNQQGKLDPPTPITSASATISAPSAPPLTPPATPPLSAAFIKLREMKEERACAYGSDVPITPARKGAKPFAAPEAHCPDKGDDFFCDFVEIAPKGANACFVSNDHIRAFEKQANSKQTSPSQSNDPWDGKKIPKYFNRIDDHLHLDENEKKLLRTNGFVVLDRLAYSNYAHAFHDVFQEELPLYVGVDPILHAVFRATDGALEIAERKRLAPALEKMLGKLRKRLAVSKNVYDETTLKDLDLYIGIATLLAKQWTDEDKPLSVLGQDAAVKAMHDSIWNKEGLVPVEIFGRSRMIDVSQYTARGHYTHFDAQFNFEAYFRAITWLTRFEWNLVSRDSRSSHPDVLPDPRETPREARDALALADLFRQSGALAELTTFDDVYAAFGGIREDVSIPKLLELMDRDHFGPRDPDAPEKLKIAIGSDFKRTARMFFMPQNVQRLPVISTLLGPRISPDIAPLEKLVHDSLPGRMELGAADVGYILGHDRAEHYLRDELQKYPDLKKALDSSREEMAKRASQTASIQGSFLQSVLTLAQHPSGSVPSFMKRDAFADMRLSSALVGYGQIRHTFVLLSGQGYDAYGCAIPDAYVEPLDAFYAATLKHVERLRKITGGGFNGLTRVLETLSNISKTEASRGAPTKAQSQWLGMVAEYIPQGGYADSGEPPKWTGWYFDMFEDREIGATKEADFIADYFTLTNLGQVAYLGAEGPRLGVFVVDTGGEPRAMVGPVARGYETKAPLADRLTDESARTTSGKTSAFRASFAAKPWTEPQLGMGVRIVQCPKDGKLEVRALVASNKPAGPVTITLLDHHADPIAGPLSADVQDEIVVFPFRFPDIPFEGQKGPSIPDELDFTPRKVKYLVEAFSLRIEDLKHSGLGSGSYDYFTSPSVFFGKGNEENLPVRSVGTGPAFVIGGEWHSTETKGETH